MPPIDFATFAARWLAQGKPTVREATHVSCAGAVVNPSGAFLGDVDLRAIAPETVRRFVSAKAAATRPDGRPVWSPKTLSNMLGSRSWSSLRRPRPARRRRTPPSG